MLTIQQARRKLGDDHPLTVVLTNNLAEVLRPEGDLDYARAVGEQAVEASRRVFGAEHPTTLMAMNNLALALHAKGDAAAARDLHEQELVVCRRVRGEERDFAACSVRSTPTR